MFSQQRNFWFVFLQAGRKECVPVLPLLDGSGCSVSCWNYSLFQSCFTLLKLIFRWWHIRLYISLGKELEWRWSHSLCCYPNELSLPRLLLLGTWVADPFARNSRVTHQRMKRWSCIVRQSPNLWILHISEVFFHQQMFLIVVDKCWLIAA